MIRPARTYRYGSHPAQVVDLYLPQDLHLPEDLHQPEEQAGKGTEGQPETLAPQGVAVLVHGGFWRARYDRSLEHRIAADLVRSGWAVWNVDYRGVDPSVPGPDGGGWPYTYQDVAEAGDLLVDAAGEHGLHLARVVAIGHSAGGALALWLAGRRQSRLRLHAVVAQAGVCDLRAAERAGLGDGAVRALFGGGPDDDATRAAYLSADPTALVPLGIPTLLVTGDADDVVPASLSHSYAAAARAAGDRVDLWQEPDAGHMVHVDPGSAAWRAVRQWLSDPAGHGTAAQ